MVEAINAMIDSHPRWGFWKTFKALRRKGHGWNHKRVYRIYCNLKLNQKRRAKKRLPQRLKQPLLVPSLPNQVWSADFMSDTPYTGKRFRTFNVIDDFNREIIHIEIDTSITGKRLIRIFERLRLERGLPDILRVDNGPEFLCGEFVAWAESAGMTIQYIQPGEPTIVFDVDIDSGSASVAIGHGTISDPYVELIEHHDRTDWLPDRIVSLVKKWQPTAVACNGAGPAGAMVGPVQFALAQAGLDYQVRQFNGQEYQQACGGIYASIVQGELSRPPGQGPLDLAGEDATDRPLGDAWVWDRRSATVPISPLVAVTIARALLPIEAPGRSVFAY